ncbi:TPA: DUF1833 family protein [Stenotrophomonas maltophilia]|uniref:DUF1833 family protein n=1 Tax=Stenotrophomonas sp. GD03680 TaxID=2975365 RepID=UPI0018D2CC00|nr:DUF1833 family protein [Stenotrophomonas sp. GD03680]MBH1593610.1 DUF1833 family protein [Stenotrophomonas maltophilia]MDH2022493.1 DUF1833 domain-containing protein [Stenotrophomonas sp. GD03680]HEL3748616.1 DUF1833 family protein [Stenotrophomonas maltophilia]HEL5053333.1 DUF1833 family protein [Stenotrophomonas maltophilia]HEL7729634.1 DUF1833 family protein [Stenotrophomonas maltophilia]
MSILERLYASGGREVELETLAIQVGAQTFYLTKGWDDITATLETGEVVTFTACGMDIAKPARNADGVQDLRFAISNISGVVSTQIRAALEAKVEMVATFRLYLSTDLLAPAQRPFSVVVKGGQWTATEVQITAGFMNVLDTAWPRDRYVLSKHPGLRYM